MHIKLEYIIIINYKFLLFINHHQLLFIAFQDSNKIINVMKDVLCLWPRWIVAAIFLIAHCLLTFMLHVPGCPTGKILFRK